MLTLIKQLSQIITIALILSAPLGVSTACAQDINLDYVTAKAINFSPEGHQASRDIKIAELTGIEHLAENSLVLKFKFNSELSKDLLSGSEVIAIGNTALGSNTKYQNSASLALSSPIFHYDVVKHRSAYDDNDLQIKKIAFEVSKKNTRLSVLGSYAEAVLVYKEYAMKKQQLLYYRDLFTLKQRLNRAGTLSKVDVADEALTIAGLLNDIDSLRLKLSSTLLDLSVLTGEPYLVDTTKLADIDEPFLSGVMAEKTITGDMSYRINELEIAKKKIELELEAKGNLPGFDGYAQYTVYGSDPTSGIRAVKNMRSANLNLGVSSAFTLFDGFVSAKKQDLLKLEIEKLTSHNETLALQINADKLKLKVLAEAYEKNKSTGSEQNKKITEKTVMVERLSQEKISDSLQFLQIKIDNILMAFDLEKNKINNLAAIKRQLIMLEDSN